jgi:hypothetical protein
VLVSGGAGHTGPPAKVIPAKLAAWAITSGPDHTIFVYVRELKGAAGLQGALRAHGVPARVTYGAGSDDSNPPLPADCRPAQISANENAVLQTKIAPREPIPSGTNKLALTLRPSAIPHGIGVYLAVSSCSDPWSWGMDLVQASPHCTGS